MIRRILSALTATALLFSLGACASAPKTIKIGASMGVGGAARWPQELAYMQARADELGIEFEGRLSTDEEAQPQFEDCKALIDSGIDVLLLTPRKVDSVSEILAYAAEHKVKVISYARCVMNDPIDLYIGFDTNQIGRLLGKYLSEVVYEGDYILLRGDPGDFNTEPLYAGAMTYIEPMTKEGVNIIFDDYVPGWSADTAKQLVMEAVQKNGGKVDAILAPNDGLAGGAVEGLIAAGVDPATVAVTGMDAELSALQRIVTDAQNITVNLDLKELASSAVDQAAAVARGEKVEVNTAVENGSGAPVSAFLVSGKTVTRENLDRLFIDTGIYTRDEIYGVEGAAVAP